MLRHNSVTVTVMLPRDTCLVTVTEVQMICRCTVSEAVYVYLLLSVRGHFSVVAGAGKS